MTYNPPTSTLEKHLIEAYELFSSLLHYFEHYLNDSELNFSYEEYATYSNHD